MQEKRTMYTNRLVPNKFRTTTSPHSSQDKPIMFSIRQFAQKIKITVFVVQEKNETPEMVFKFSSHVFVVLKEQMTWLMNVDFYIVTNVLIIFVNFTNFHITEKRIISCNFIVNLPNKIKITACKECIYSMQKFYFGMDMHFC